MMERFASDNFEWVMSRLTAESLASSHFPDGGVSVTSSEIDSLFGRPVRYDDGLMYGMVKLRLGLRKLTVRATP